MTIDSWLTVASLFVVMEKQGDEIPQSITSAKYIQTVWPK
jgi:hypothetical protein